MQTQTHTRAQPPTHMCLHTTQPTPPNPTPNPTPPHPAPPCTLQELLAYGHRLRYTTFATTGLFAGEPAPQQLHLDHAALWERALAERHAAMATAAAPTAAGGRGNGGGRGAEGCGGGAWGRGRQGVVLGGMGPGPGMLWLYAFAFTCPGGHAACTRTESKHVLHMCINTLVHALLAYGRNALSEPADPATEAACASLLENLVAAGWSPEQVRGLTLNQSRKETVALQGELQPHMRFVVGAGGEGVSTSPN